MHLEEMIRKAQRPYPQGKLEIAALVATLILISIGILHSVVENNWQHLGQVGSLIVISGIVLAWQDIVGNLDRYVQLVKSHSVTNNKSVQAKHLPEAPMTSLDIAKREASKWDEAMLEYMGIRRHRLRTTEALLLIVGTFLGGYGADIGNCIYQFR